MTARPQRCRAACFTSRSLATNVLVRPRRTLRRVSHPQAAQDPRDRPGRAAASTSPTASTSSGSCQPHSVDVIVTSPPYNLGIQYNRYQDTLSRGGLPGVDRHLGRGGGPGAAAGRLAVPERRRQAERPVDGARRRAGRRARTCGCRTSFTGSSRSPSTATSAGAAAGLTRDLAVGHYKPINSDRFLNDCHEFIFHFTPRRRDRARSARARRALSGPVEHRPLARRGRAACAAAATRGSSRTRRSSAATATGRIPATFPSRLPEQCLRLHGLDRIRARDGSVHRARQHGRRLRAARRRLRRAPISTRPTCRKRRSTRCRTRRSRAKRDGMPGTRGRAHG